MAVGVHGNLLRWLSSYIHCRSQFVSLNGYISSAFVVTPGVYQGSHLGLLLFLILIIDIKEFFEHWIVLLYADDLKVFKKIISIQDCLKIQEDLQRFSVYCCKILISISPPSNFIQAWRVKNWRVEGQPAKLTKNIASFSTTSSLEELFWIYFFG